MTKHDTSTSNTISMINSTLVGVGFIFLATTLSVSAAEPVSANPNPGVVPIDETAQNDDRTYSQLANDWWNWAGQFSREDGPIENDGFTCSLGQSGKVWFLSGNSGGPIGGEPAERYCTVPNGTALFFPIVNAVGWVPVDGSTVAEARQNWSNFIINIVSALEVQITSNDEVLELEDLFAYRAQSPAGGFDFNTVWEDSYPDPSETEPQSVSDGFWILLEPLPKGDHVIHFRGELAEFDLEFNVTYYIKVDNNPKD